MEIGFWAAAKNVRVESNFNHETHESHEIYCEESLSGTPAGSESAGYTQEFIEQMDRIMRGNLAGSEPSSFNRETREIREINYGESLRGNLAGSEPSNFNRETREIREIHYGESLREKQTESENSENPMKAADDFGDSSCSPFIFDFGSSDQRDAGRRPAASANERAWNQVRDDGHEERVQQNLENPAWMDTRIDGLIPITVSGEMLAENNPAWMDNQIDWRLTGVVSMESLSENSPARSDAQIDRRVSGTVSGERLAENNPAWTDNQIDWRLTGIVSMESLSENNPARSDTRIDGRVHGTMPGESLSENSPVSSELRIPDPGFHLNGRADALRRVNSPDEMENPARTPETWSGDSVSRADGNVQNRESETVERLQQSFDNLPRVETRIVPGASDVKPVETMERLSENTQSLRNAGTRAMTPEYQEEVLSLENVARIPETQSGEERARKNLNDYNHPSEHEARGTEHLKVDAGLAREITAVPVRDSGIAPPAGIAVTEPDPTPGLSRQAREFISQVAERVRIQIRNGREMMRIQLNPENLGRMEIQAGNGKTGVSTRIAAESLEVKNLLESNLSLLRQTLQEQGIKVEKIEVFVQDGIEAFAAFGGGDRSGNAGTARRDLNDSGFTESEDVKKEIFVNETEAHVRVGDGFYMVA